PGPWAPAQDGSGTIEPGIANEMIAIPIGFAEQGPLAELGEVGRQRGVEIRPANQLHPGTLGKETAEPSPLKRVVNSGQIESPFFIEETFARLDMLLDPVHDPQQAWRRTAGKEGLSDEQLSPNRVDQRPPAF